MAGKRASLMSLRELFLDQKDFIKNRFVTSRAYKVCRRVPGPQDGVKLLVCQISKKQEQFKLSLLLCVLTTYF